MINEGSLSSFVLTFGDHRIYWIEVACFKAQYKFALCSSIDRKDGIDFHTQLVGVHPMGVFVAVRGLYSLTNSWGIFIDGGPEESGVKESFGWWRFGTMMYPGGSICGQDERISELHCRAHIA
ncbi:hypothetical protein Tco_1211085 [Tanacetum coccineum]